MSRTARTFQRAQNPSDHPDENCGASPGDWVPLVNRKKCEGKADCVAVCPYDVFVVARISDDEYRALPFLSKIKLRVHGMKTAYTPRADLCQACGLCVAACPEKAISLVRGL